MRSHERARPIPGESQEPREQRVDPDAWEAAIADTDGPQIVVGGPGTGKTEFLVRRVAHLVDDVGIPGDRVLVLSFGRRGVADLADRIGKRLSRPTTPVPVVTFHSLAAGLVESAATSRGWAAPPQILTGPEQTALVRRLLSTEDAARWPMPFRALLATATFADEITDFLLRASEQMLTPTDVASLAEGRADWRALPAFMARYRAELLEAGRIDYGLLLAEAAAIAADDPSILTRYSHVLVDEYQDTTVSQARLLAAVSAGHHNLTAAADPYQSIYSFRGAAVQNVARFPTDFPDAAGQPARRIVLTTSFRTPAEILAAAERVAAHALPGAAGPVVPSSGQGRVDVHIFDQHTAEAEWIAAEILRLHLTEGLPYRRMAVFVRSKRRFLPELSRALQRRAVPHDPPSSRLAEQPAVRFVLDVVAAATAPGGAEVDRALRRVLLGGLFALPLGRLRDLEREAQANGMDWPEAIRVGGDDIAPLADLVADPSWADQRPAVEGLWHVWSALPQVAALVRDPARRPERAAWASLSQVLERWNERNADATLADYSTLLLEEEFEAQPLLSYTLPEEDRVTVTTLHQAKGLEFDVVFIADAVEGVFPDLRTRDSLLGVRHLLSDVPHDAAGYQRFRLQEERRLAYTAMTRAARQVVWTSTTSGFEKGKGIPSRFLALVAGTDSVQGAATPRPSDRPPVTPAEAEAMVRRLVGDPAAPAPARMAALDVLTQGPRLGLRDPWSFSGLRERGGDSGVVTTPLRLSPSQADAYVQCPRRYVLQRRLGIGDHPGPHATLGKLVHHVLERVGRLALARNDARGEPADALEALDELFDPGEFGGEPLATAWRRRAEAAIRRLYELWPSDGRVVDVERRFEVELGGVAWLGYADRVEQRDKSVAIVDYKTSGTIATIDDAAASLQLGFYLLAAAADPELAKIGPPDAAEFWYPYASRNRKSMAVRSFDPGNSETVELLLKSAADGIRGERWEPTPSDACERCPVRIVCPTQPEGEAGFLA